MPRTLWCNIVLGFLIALKFHQNQAKLMSECLKVADIVPDVIDQSPLIYIRVVYGLRSVFLNCGNDLTPRNVKLKPRLWWLYDPIKFYTVIMIDPYGRDSTTANPRKYQFLHWMVVNMQGFDTSKGETRVEYVGAAPPSNGEIHPYVFLLFEQNCTQEFDVPYMSISDDRRDKFNVRNFIKQNNLQQPIGSNSFTAKYDSYVPFLRKRLGLVKSRK